MKRPSIWRRALRSVAALNLAFAVSVSALPLHQGHDMSKMPGMSKPKPKSAVRKKKPRAKAKRTGARNRGLQKPAPSPSPVHENMPGMQMPGAAPSPSPPREMMPGMQMPKASSSPGPSHEMMPGMQMPTASPLTVMPDQDRRAPLRDDLPEGPVLRLEDLERMALEKNPTIAQAESSILVSQGRRSQAGLFPNPIVGYTGENLAFRALNQKSAHGVFVEQTIPLGGKLSKAKQVFARETEQAQMLAEAQRLRVINSVRLLYYDALGAQRLVDLRIELGNLAREAADITKELYNLGQADRPDQLEIEIEVERAEIDLLRAKNDREQVWSALAAMVSDPNLRPVRLTGNLEQEVTINQDELLNTLLLNSPEIKAGQANVERARAVLVRAQAQKSPDLFLRGGVAYSNEVLESDLRKTGAEGMIEAGISVPIFNRNQGGIAAAAAELAIAEREQDRVKLLLRARFASAFREYRNAQQTAEKYHTQVIPRARAGYEMYLSNFRQMAASYPQVIIAQRTLFRVEVEYAKALLALKQSGVMLRGFLLTGGLDQVGRPGEFTEGSKLRSPNEGAGDSDKP